jgi:ribonuclease J
MHGEARHLKEHAKLAVEMGAKSVVTAYNGEILRLAPGPARIIDDAPVGRLFRDGRFIIPSEEGPVRERRKLAWVGLVAVAITMNKRGEVLGQPQAVLDGVPLEDADGGSMLDIVLDAVEGTLRSIPPARRRDTEVVAEAVRRAVRGAVADEWGKKPVAKVLITVVEGK